MRGNHIRDNGCMDEPSTPDAALQEAAEIAGDRWVLLALGALRDGARRFGDLSADMPGIAPNILIDRLRRMERHGLITSSPYSQRPRRYVYALTESGRELATVLPALAGWAARRAGRDPLLHATCGTPLEVQLWCPSCMTVVDSQTHEHPSDVELRWL